MLTPRLELILKYVKGKTVADIGTDHAYIPIELKKNEICERVIASDVNKGPAEIAKNNVKQQGLDIDVRLGSGLSVLTPGEADDIIVAGMGGKLIAELLAAEYETAKKSRLILQPMNGQYELRKFLISNGFSLCHEDLALEGFKVYNLIICDSREKPLTYDEEIDFHVPRFLKTHEYYIHLKNKKLREFTKIMNGYKKSAAETDFERAEYYSGLIDLIQNTKDTV